jgi:hypothetical protein
LQRALTFIHCIPFVIQFLCLIVQQLLVLVTLLEIIKVILVCLTLLF